jgi:hypothetical protein
MALDIDPIFTIYGAPVIVAEPYSITDPDTEFLSIYDPVVYDLTWPGDTMIFPGDGIGNIRMEAAVYYGSTPVLLGTQVKTSIDISGTITYRFNVSEMLKTVLSPEIFNPITSDTINTGNENIVVPYKIHFTVKFDDISTTRTDNTLISDTYYACNSIIQPDETNRIINKGTSAYIADSSTSKFLTKSANNQVISTNEDYQLSFITAEIDSAKLQFQTYDLGGNANAETTRATVDTTNSKYGTLTISDNGASSILDGFATISKVDVWIENTSNVEITEKKTFIINQGCSNGYRLWWHNSLGGIDKYTFDQYTNKSYEQEERINYQKPLGTTIAPSNISMQTMATKGNIVYTAVSKFETDLNQFVDLLNSTEIYYQPDVSSSTLVAVTIISDSQAISDSDGLIQVTIEFMNSQAHKTHIA